MRDDAQAEMIRYAPKACLDFRAILGARTPLAAYRHLQCPSLVMQGERAHPAAEIVARRVVHALRYASPRTVLGAGHMGPLTHADTVATMIAEFIRRHDEDDADHSTDAGLDRAA
jgi:pimeloyl-ACP methyl ester carboxylesterase